MRSQWSTKIVQVTNVIDERLIHCTLHTRSKTHHKSSAYYTYPSLMRARVLWTKQTQSYTPTELSIPMVKASFPLQLNHSTDQVFVRLLTSCRQSVMSSVCTVRVCLLSVCCQSVSLSLSLSSCLSVCVCLSVSLFVVSGRFSFIQLILSSVSVWCIVFSKFRIFHFLGDRNLVLVMMMIEPKCLLVK